MSKSHFSSIQFEVVDGHPTPVLDSTTPGAQDILGGFEGGRVMKLDGMYHYFATERAGREGMEKYFDRIRTRLAHWRSTDGLQWERVSTLFESTARETSGDGNGPDADRRGVLFAPMPEFDTEENVWNLFYVAYTWVRDIEPNHLHGRIWRAVSTVKGPQGYAGPYQDVGVILQPGPESQPWEGHQGVAAFFPYRVGEKWYGFYCTAYGRGKAEIWPSGLAWAPKLAGPWTRCGLDLNPCTYIHPKFVENPVVTRIPDGRYVAVFDGGPAYLGVPGHFAYTTSEDGVHWSSAVYVDLESTVNKWWTVMRTPLCLLPEGDDIYKVFYTARVAGRFFPMGMARLRLVLKE